MTQMTKKTPRQLTALGGMLSRPAEGGTGKHVLVHMLTRDPGKPESRESMPPKTSAAPSGTVI
jgi:hypothetical protein